MSGSCSNQHCMISRMHERQARHLCALLLVARIQDPCRSGRESVFAAGQLRPKHQRADAIVARRAHLRLSMAYDNIESARLAFADLGMVGRPKQKALAPAEAHQQELR